MIEGLVGFMEGGIRLKFGVFLITPGRYSRSVPQTYREVLDEAVLAESLGFDSVWFAEHHFDPNFCLTPSPNLMAAAVAVRTHSIRIGLAVNVLPLHHPLRLAEEAAMLDVLSNGRLIWGIGRGVSKKEFDPWNVPLEETAERTREAHELILRLWQEEEVNFNGTFYSVQGARLAPKPLQTPHPAVWTVATSPPSVRWAAEQKMPFMQVARPVDAMRQSWLEYQKHYEAVHGETVSHEGLVPLRYVFLADSDEHARQLAAPHLTEFWEGFSRIDAPDPEMVKPVRGYEFAFENRKRRREMRYEDVVREGIGLIGSPETCLEQIQRHAEMTDMRYLMCDFWRASMTHEDRVRVMRDFSETVISELA